MLGIHFSLKIGSMFDLNYKTKLKQIEGILNFWHTRNLSLISNICVIKTLLLPQLPYLFSVLCIKIPKYVLELDKMFYQFIWNGGNDRVQRAFFFLLLLKVKTCFMMLKGFFLKNWFWTLIFFVKIEGNLIFL